MSDEYEPPPSATDGGQTMFQIIKQLFREFCADHDLDTEQMQNVRMRQFYDWYHQSAQQLNIDTPLRDELAEKLHVADGQVFDDIHQFFQDPFSLCQLLFPWWPMLVLAGRPPLRYPVASVNIILQVQYQDGKQLSLMGQAPSPGTPMGEPFTDGSATTLFREYGVRLSDMIGVLGLDALHEKHAVYPPGAGPAPTPDQPSKIWLPESDS